MPTVLVVDDKPDVADNFAATLQRAGFDAIPAYGPQHALCVAAVIVPDVLLTGLVLHAMDGMQLAREILARHPACKVLILSDVRESESKASEPAASGEAFCVIEKPNEPRQLVKALRQLTASPLIYDPAAMFKIPH